MLLDNSQHINVKDVLVRAGLDVRSIDKPSSGYASSIFYCNIGGKYFYVSLLNEERYTVLSLLLQRLGENSFIPIASIEDRGYDKQSENYYLIQTPIAGVSLNRISLRDSLLREAGEILRKIHSLSLKGYGRLVCSVGEDLRGKFDTWADFIREQIPLETINYLSEHGILSVGQSEVIRKTREEVCEMPLVSGSLLHNDYHRGHIYSDDNGISGIIDWEAAIVGVAEYDLAMSAHFLGSDFPKLLKGYGSDVNSEHIQKYELLIAAHKMVWAHSRHPSKSETKRSILNAALSRIV